MNKDKTMEVLRGMKFMQRKEEAKRRALYEENRRGQLTGSSSGGTDADGTPRARKGPVVLFDNTFPTASYSLGRRSFKHAEASGAAGTSGEATVAVAKDSAVGETDADFVEDTEDLWAEETNAEYGEDPTAVPSSTSERKRFHPEGAIRAPKLPKKLAGDVEAQELERKRRKKEEDDDGGVGPI